MCPSEVAPDSPSVGFVGLGQMGSLLADHLTGWPGGLLVHDLRPDAAAALGDKGAGIASSVEELASASDIICVMVVDDEQVREVLGAALPHVRPGAVIAVHSTIRASTAIALGAQFRDRGVAVLDAPVSGGVAGAQSGRLAIMVGGELAALERCREAFRRFADLVVHFGPVGAGTRAKLARNVANVTAIAAALEAQRLAETAGVDLAKLARVTTHSDAVTGGPSMIMIRAATGPLAEDDPLRPAFAHTRELGEKDLALALEMGAEAGLDMPVARSAYQRLAEYLGLAHEELG